MANLISNFLIKTYGPNGIQSIVGPTTLANARRVADQSNAWNVENGRPHRAIVLAKS